jgi:tartrate dehydratase beta subunit/fumarate hydratase class I family protein
MKTIAEQLNVKEFPLKINDSNGNEIYYEDSDGKNKTK